MGKRKASGQVAGADPPPQKKFYRTKSAQWGVTLNSILKTMTGKDLDWWRVPEDTTLPAADWPYLGISPDQGPDGFCFLHYLVGPGRVNAQLWRDPSHVYGEIKNEPRNSSACADSTCCWSSRRIKGTDPGIRRAGTRR